MFWGPLMMRDLTSSGVGPTYWGQKGPLLCVRLCMLGNVSVRVCSP